MPPVINVGGSITGAVALTLVAWGVRTLRAHHLRRQAANHKAQHRRFTRMGKYFFAISPAALRMLIETQPIPHYLIDVRTLEEVPLSPLPPELQSALHIPGGDLEAALGSEEAWRQILGPDAPPRPATGNLLVFLSSGAEAARTAAAVAASLGHHRSAVLQQGLEGYQAAAAQQPDLQFLSRDALAAILGLTTSRSAAPATVIDLRRGDERAMYGAIPGTVHLPVDQLASALQRPADEFQRLYHFPKPTPADPVVLHCRANRRAAWAAQLCLDAGLQRVLVFRQGVYGWRFDPSVKVYRNYEQGEVPPEPEPFQVEAPDQAAASTELQGLGLVSPTSSPAHPSIFPLPGPPANAGSGQLAGLLGGGGVLGGVGGVNGVGGMLGNGPLGGGMGAGGSGVLGGRASSMDLHGGAGNGGQTVPP